MTVPDQLTALAARWETWAAEASTLAALVERDQDRAHLRAQASRAIQDAADLRTLAATLAARGGSEQNGSGRS